MSQVLGSMGIELKVDSSQFGSGLNAAKKQLNYFRAEVRTLDTALKGNGSNMDLLKAKHGSLNQAVESQKKVLSNLNAILKETDPGTAKWERTAIEIKKYEGQLVDTTAQLKAVEEAMKKVAAQNSFWGQASARLTDFGNQAVKVGDKIGRVGNNISQFGSTLTRSVSAPLLAGAGVATKAAIDYESAFAGVKKTVDETATTSYAKLSDGIRNMSKELPASAVEIANVAEAAGQLGIKTDNILDFTKVMINMGESTNMAATDAATSLAKFANITKMAPENYDRLGASIVDLGNNFATTESDIVDMSLRLAGAGKQIGLSEADTLGLAAALSSVGIEAEMGGSAISKIMVNMQVATKTGLSQMQELTEKTGYTRRELELMSSTNSKGFKKVAESVGMTTNEITKVLKSSKNLENFGKIAGMTGAEFKQAFEKDAIGALGKFIEGLGTAEEKGSSAIEMLDEMGISEVRLRDSLLRAGNATELFSRAIDTSNKAWGESTALTNEANKRYETTEAKLKMLKNQVTDIAIKFGGPLVDALRDSLTVAQPWIEKAGAMAEAFSNMDQEQQRSILKWAGIVAAAGPALKVFGTSVQVVGSLTKGLGYASKGLAGVAGVLSKMPSSSAGLTAISTAVSGVGTASAGAATQAGLLGSAAALLGNPVTWGVLLGGAAVAAVGLWAVKAGEAQQRAQEWGTKIDQLQAKELTKLKDKVDISTQAMDSFGARGAEDVQKVQDAFGKLTDEIAKAIDKNLEKDLKIAEKLGLSDEEVQRIKNKSEEVKQTTQKMSDDVLVIYKNANNQQRQLSAEETQIVKSAQTALIEEQLAQLKYSKEQKKAITQAMNGEIEILNKEQAKKSLETVTKWIEDENKVYQKQKKDIKRLHDEGKLNQETYHREMQELEASHQMAIGAYGDKYIALRKKIAENTTFYSDANIKKEMDALGLSFEEFKKQMEGTAETASKTSTAVAVFWQGMSKEAEQATVHWNSLVLDEKTGKVKTNAADEVAKALQAEGGWESLKFDAKHANLTTNARAMIAEALAESGQWAKLSLEEKKLVVNGNEAMLAVFNSKEGLSAWNALSPQQKELSAIDMTLGALLSAQGTMDSLKDVTRDLKGRNMTQAEKDAAQATLDSLIDVQRQLLATNATQPQKDAAQATMDSLRDVKRSLMGEDLTRSARDSAQNTLNSLMGVSRDLTANDRTGEGVSWAQRNIDSLKDKEVNIFTNFIERVFKHERGTTHHPGGMAMVNDQKGSTYRELVTLPSGRSFIPNGRDVILPLPKGSKVLPAKQTAQLFSGRALPRYADGVGIPADAPIFKSMQEVGQHIESTINIQGGDNGRIVALLTEILSYLRSNHSRLDVNVTGALGYQAPEYQKIADVVGRKLAEEIVRIQGLRGVVINAT